MQKNCASGQDRTMVVREPQLDFLSKRVDASHFLRPSNCKNCQCAPLFLRCSLHTFIETFQVASQVFTVWPNRPFLRTIEVKGADWRRSGDRPNVYTAPWFC